MSQGQSFDKCHLLVSSSNPFSFKIGGFGIKYSYCEILVVRFDHKLFLDNRIYVKKQVVKLMCLQE